MQANMRKLGTSGYRYVHKVVIRGTDYWQGRIGSKKGFNPKVVKLPESTLGDFTLAGAESVARLVDVELVKLGRGADTTFFIGEDGVEVARLLVR
jgi:hypothetical protein